MEQDYKRKEIKRIEIVTREVTREVTKEKDTKSLMEKMRDRKENAHAVSWLFNAWGIEGEMVKAGWKQFLWHILNHR